MGDPQTQQPAKDSLFCSKFHSLPGIEVAETLVEEKKL